MAYKNLQKLMAFHGVKKGDIAAMLGRDPAVATNLFKGDRRLSGEEAIMFARRFETTPEIIMDDDEWREPGFEAPAAREWGHESKLKFPISRAKLAKTSQQVSIVGYVGAGAEIITYDDHAKGDGFYMVDCPTDMNPAKTVALEVAGDSMEPLISEGFLIFYDQRFNGIPDEWLGKICVVKVVDGPTLIKRVKKSNSVGLYKLICINPNNGPVDAEIEWSALVKTMVQR